MKLLTKNEQSSPKYLASGAKRCLTLISMIIILYSADGLAFFEGPTYCDELPSIENQIIAALLSKNLNIPDAYKNNDGNTKAIKYEQALIKRKLLCSDKAWPKNISTSILNSKNPDKFKTGFHFSVIQSLKEGVLGRDLIAKAIYLNELGFLSDSSKSTIRWKLQTAKNWCKSNSTLDHDVMHGALIPKGLTTLEQGVRQLDALAITLGWSSIQNRNSARLGMGCDSAVMKFFN